MSCDTFFACVNICQKEIVLFIIFDYLVVQKFKMNLAPRSSMVTKTGTTNLVGPNTYDVGECCKYNKKNLAPFLSTAIRMKPLKKTGACDFYESSDCLLPRIKYGNSMQYTAERKTIVVPKDETDESKIVRSRNVKYIPSKQSSSSRGKVAFCRVPFEHGYSAPSIPHKDCTGYDLDENEMLFKNPPEDIDTTGGPASYNVPQGELCFNTIRYAGCAWSKSKSKRDMTATNSNPGPTAYSPKDPKCVRYCGDFQRRALMRKCCNVPRYACELSCKSKFEKMPAPGTYEIVDLSNIGKVKNLSLQPRPFICAGKRFQYKSAEGPGPQTYQVCDCFKLKRDYNIAEVPFKNTAIRLKSTIRNVTPAPGAYEIQDPDYHRFEKDVKRPAFHSTAQRKFFDVQGLDTPDPASYDPPPSVKCASLQKENRSSVFKSMVCRFGRFKDKTDLSAASYNIDDAFNYITGKVAKEKPNRVGFNSTEKQGNCIPDFAGQFAFYGRKTPGVGTYDIKLDCICESKGFYFKTSPRGDLAKNERTPGPGHYQLHPSKVEAFWEAKRTYNNRLFSNVIRRNPQMKGPKLGMRSSVKASRKKILRYFVKTGDFKHCWD